MDSELKASLIKIGGVLAVFAAVLAAYIWLTLPGPLGGDFTLQASNGRQVTQADLRAKPSAVFFGYTHCPDICPTTVADMQSWLEKLGPKADKINVWFITVDPERDTPQILHDYLGNVSDRILGISGAPEAVHRLAASFNIAAKKVNGEDGEYTYDHTAAVILLNQGGRQRGMIAYQEDPQIAIEQMQALADSAKN